MALDIDKSDSVTVTEAIYPLLGIGVSDAATVFIFNPKLPVSVHDNVALSFMRLVADSIAVTESVSLSFPNNNVTISEAEDIIVHDDGQAVSILAAGVVISVSDSVGLVRMINQGDSVTVTESVAGAIGNTSGPLSVNVDDDVTVIEQVWTLAPDYVFVTESVSVYFRQVNVVASDALTVTEQAGILVQGGSGATTLFILMNDVAVIEEAVTVGAPPQPNVHDDVLADRLTLIMLPRQPNVSDGVTVSENTPAFLPVLVPSVSESVAAVDAVTFQLNPMPIVAYEDVALVEIAGIGRPAQTWEPGADSEMTWDAGSSTSDTWEEAAPAATGAWA